MKTRKLKDGRRVKELKNEVSIVINTKCPAKWLLTDLETGDQWTSTGTQDKVYVVVYAQQHFTRVQ